MPTLGALVSRSESRLRFADTDDALRYGRRPVEAVTEGTPSPEALFVTDHLGPDHLHRLARDGVAAVVLAGCAEAPHEVRTAARRHGVLLLTAGEPASQVWSGLLAIIHQEQRAEHRGQAERLKALRRLVLEPEGLSRSLRWLARQISGHAVLIDPAGAVLHAFPEPPLGLLAQADADIRRVVTRQTRSAAVHLTEQVAHIVSIGETPSAVLVVARAESFPPSLRDLVSEAASLLWLRWRVEELGRRGRQVDLAEAHSREAALHLLMLGHVHAARRVTEALGSQLPERTRVYIVECPPGLRGEYARMCADVTGGRAWIVRCPVYARHLIVLAPADSDEADAPLDQALRTLAASSTGCYVGAGRIVALRDTAAGYEQAFHALAVARGAPRAARRSAPARTSPRSWARAAARGRHGCSAPCWTTARNAARIPTARNSG